MLRPSAFQNNGNSDAASSSSKSILRPSSFQLAPSNLSAASTSSNKNECDEPTTSTDSPSEVDSPKPSLSLSPSCESTANDVATKEDDSKITSTTSNDGEIDGESSEETKPVSNPFNNSKAQNADIDEDSDTEAKSKPAEKETEKFDSQAVSKSDSGLGSNLFASTNTKNLFAAATTKTSSILNGSENNFVFGQNIRERIIGVPDTSVASSKSDDVQNDSAGGSKLFAVNSANSSGEASTNNGTETPKESSTVEDLTKVAREYEESRAQKPKLEAVETHTGEEDEVNVLDMSCKLFAFIASNWEQRGPGSLRLNDVKTSTEGSDARSRVVFRTLGNFRVLINTKVWAGMVVEKPSQKSLRLTAIDPSDGSVKIFLVMARPDDVASLQKALIKRIDAEKKLEKAAGSTENVEANSSTSNDEPEAKKSRTE